MRKYLAIPAVLAIGLTAGCGSSDDSSTTSGGSSTGSGTAASTAAAPASGGGKKVAYISPVAAQPGQQAIDLGLQEGAKALGWTDKVLDANLSADKQVANVDTAITQKYDAIASWTLDPGAAAGAYTRALSAGIPVIGMNSDGEGVTSTVWWEYSTCKPGGPADQTAEYIAKKTPGAKTIVMSGPPAPSIVAMTKCFTAAAKKAGLNIINTSNNTNDTADAAQRLMQDLLTKNPDVQAVWNYNDQSALGDAAAIQGAGKDIATDDKDGIIVVGHNGDADAITAIKDGRLTGTWDSDNVATGMAAIKQMQTAIDGGDAEKKYPALTVKSKFFTSGNIADYKTPQETKYTFDDLPLVQ
jgi:ribose transport system substrate-binding protein